MNSKEKPLKTFVWISSKNSASVQCCAVQYSSSICGTVPNFDVSYWFLKALCYIVRYTVPDCNVSAVLVRYYCTVLGCTVYITLCGTA